MAYNDNFSTHTRLKSPLSLQETNVAADSSGDFGESACGEPLTSQHLQIDFTPKAEDTEFVQKKCCAFWDFLTTCPELEYCRVLPEPKFLEKEKISDIELAPIKTENTQAEHVKTAVSMLEFVEEKGLITRAFEAKLPQSGCSLGSPDYFDDKPDISKVNKKDGITGRNEKELPRKPSSSVQEMCKDLQDWDTQHPKCRPVCKSRRRVWKGEAQKTSAELLLERKPLQECFRRWPTKVYPNSPCPLFGRTRHVTINKRGVIHSPNVVRICQAPLDDTVDTPYLRYAQIAKRLGALDAVDACCPFCACVGCCVCPKQGYALRDANRATSRRHDMRHFDARVKQDCEAMRIMYNQPY
ncbi:uncharacterized protein [Epargyreus clarus]|uniref:uncharacterized protein isoform X2 n=1 Tax=Epargyreus clarus TaxID=520877 RepID=UPI003C2B0EF5